MLIFWPYMLISRRNLLLPALSEARRRGFVEGISPLWSSPHRFFVLKKSSGKVLG
jgi:hypothetical protein